MTDFRTSTTALAAVSTSTRGIGEVGRPLLPATYLVDHPGTSPTITVPLLSGGRPDMDGIWAFLAEPADFFGMPMPDVEDLSAALGPFVERAADVPMAALDITVAELDGSWRFVVTGRVVTPIRSEPVRIDACDLAFPMTRAGDALWRRMAARTTSRGAEDQVRRWLNGRGYADGVTGGPVLGVPFLGALIFQQDDDVCGLDNAEPTSILTQLQACGAIAGVRRIEECPGDAHRAWWISPGFEIHAVAAVGTRAFDFDNDPPVASLLPPGTNNDPTFARMR